MALHFYSHPRLLPAQLSALLSRVFGLHSLTVGIAEHPKHSLQTRRSYWSGILEPADGDIAE
jgi:hypothetical protein